MTLFSKKFDCAMDYFVFISEAWPAFDQAQWILSHASDVEYRLKPDHDGYILLVQGTAAELDLIEYFLRY